MNAGYFVGLEGANDDDAKLRIHGSCQHHLAAHLGMRD